MKRSMTTTQPAKPSPTQRRARALLDSMKTFEEWEAAASPAQLASAAMLAGTPKAFFDLMVKSLTGICKGGDDGATE